MEKLIYDVKFAARMLAKRPFYTAVAILALAIGIGGNTAIFSVVNAVLLQPLPFPEPERLVILWGNHPEIGDETASGPDYVDWRDQSTSFEAMTAIHTTSMNVTGDGEPERVIAARVDAGFADVFGVPPALGRHITAAEDQPNAEKVVVLADGLWKRRYGSDPAVVGRRVQVNGVPHTVIGVTPPDFKFMDTTPDLFVPLALGPTPSGRRSDYLFVVGRLRAGVAVERAQAEMTAIAGRLAEQYPQTNATWTVRVTPAHEEMVANLRPMLLVLLGSVGFVLLIACANVANLLLARAAARQREMAIRSALGAGRGHIFRQLLTEGVLLSVAGGAVGLLVAPWATEALMKLSPPSVSALGEVSLDGVVLAFTATLSVVTGVLFGLAPALQFSGVRPQEALREGGRGTAGDRRNWVRNALVVSQVCLALVLLVGVALLVRSFNNLANVDLGFRSDNLLTMAVTLPTGKYGEPAQRVAFYDAIRERAAALPGVETLSVSAAPPIYGGGPELSFAEEGVAADANDGRDANIRGVDPDFMKSMGIPVVAGRGFTPQDDARGPNVILVNEAIVRHFWPNESPIGKRLAFDGSAAEPTWREVVGVVADIRHRGPDAPEVDAIYVPFAQRPSPTFFLMLRSDGDPTALAGAVRGAVKEVDPDQPVFAVRTMDEVLARSLAARRFGTTLLSIFGFVALFLAAVGLYAVLAYTVAQRTREIGVRMALGASRADILRLVVLRGMGLVGGGLLLGAALAAGLSRFLSTMLYEVSPVDPIAFAGAAGALALVALLACLLPARRATKVDPLVALRCD